MFANFAVGFFGLLIFLFIFWKKLKEDYSSELIFTIGFLVITSIVFGQKYLWLQVTGILISFAVAVWKYKMRFNEVFDALTIALLPWISINFLKISVLKVSTKDFISFVTTLALIGIYFLIDANYKKFRWYRSGKIGLAGGVTLLLLITFYCVMLFV